MNLSGNGRTHASCLAAALLVAAPILALFGPALVTDRSLAMRDAAHFYHPLLKWTSDRWLAAGPPLWQPYENTGMPLLADASSSLFYPGRLLLFLPIDFAWRYKLYVVGHAILVALGAYLLARHWRATWQAAAIAAIAYSCGGSVVFQHCNVVFLVGAAWLPFAVWTMDRMLVERSWRAAIALGAVLALMILGGDPQMAYHALLMAALYATVLPFGNSPSPTVGFGLRSLMLARRWSLVALAAVCGFLLAAIQVLPSSEAAAASDRASYTRPRNVYEAAGYLARNKNPNRWSQAARGLFGQPEPGTHHERAYEFSLAPWRLVELIWPNIGGRMFPTHRRWMNLVPAEARVWTPTIYLGLVPLVLAVAQWRIRRTEPHLSWLSWLLLLFTVASFGSFGLGWCVREFYATVLRGDPNHVPLGSPVGGLYWLMVTFLPMYINFRYPTKLLIVAALAASQLAARGWDRVLEGESPRLTGFLKRLAIGSVVLLVICWFAFSWLNQTIERNTPLGREIALWLASHGDRSFGPFDLAGSERDVYFSLIQTAAVCLAAVWLLKKVWHDPRPRWRLALLALVAADVAAANYWLVPTAPADTWRTPPSAIAAMKSDARRGDVAAGDAVRVHRVSFGPWRPPSFLQGGSKNRMAQIAAWERDTLFPKYGLNHGISLVESYGSLKSVDFESFLFIARRYGPIAPGGGGHELAHPDALRLLGTQYVVVPDNWQPAWPNQPPFATPVSPPPEIQLAEGAALWRLHDPLPRAWIVHEVERLPPLTGNNLAAVDERTRVVLFPAANGASPPAARNFRQSAVVETELPIELPARYGPAGEEECRITRYDLRRVQIEATLSAPGLVILSDTFAPGWIATVETENVSRSVPILRTDRICRGVLLPAGQHRITYEYRAGLFLRGAWISGAAWLALLAVAGWGLLRRTS